MNNKLKLLGLSFGAVIAGLFVWMVLPFHHQQSATEEEQLSHRPQSAALETPALHSHSSTGTVAVIATSASPANLSAEDARRFHLYTTAARFYEPETADKLRLSDNERLAVNFVAWQYRNRLNALIANEAVIRTQRDKSITISYALDAATADRLQAEFLDDLRGAVGDVRMQAIEHSSLLSEIEMHLEYWGRAPTAYSIKIQNSNVGNQETIVSIDVLSDKTPHIVRSSAFPKSIFASIYGPVAKKIGL